jgi:hypothetical protein
MHQDAYSLGFESFDGLEVSIDIIGYWLEFAQQFLGVVYDSLVFQGRTIVGKVDGRGLG